MLHARRRPAARSGESRVAVHLARVSVRVRVTIRVRVRIRVSVWVRIRRVAVHRECEFVPENAHGLCVAGLGSGLGSGLASGLRLELGLGLGLGAGVARLCVQLRLAIAECAEARREHQSLTWGG